MVPYQEGATLEAHIPSENSHLASELAYVRSIAEEGRDAPLVSGVFYVIWGGLMGLASLCAYLALTGVAPFASFGATRSWIFAGFLGWGASMVIGRRMGAKPGSLTLGNRTARAVWFAVGLFMTAFWMVLMIVHDDFTALGVPPYFLFSLMFPIAFGVYGVAFYATAVAARLKWLKGFAFLSWGFAGASMFLMASHMQFLLGAAGCFLCAGLPGILLMRAEPKEIV